jgi:thiosulfate/3-mercaptopyruvate sulfurtransferase
MKSTQHAVSFFTLLAVMTVVSAATSSCSQTESTQKPQPKIESLVSTQWLSEHLDDPDLIVLDCTVLIETDENGVPMPVSGRANYDAGHIPNAGFADLLGALSDQESSLILAMPTPQQFGAAMSALGVASDSRVVLYSADTPDWAARVWWMLRWAGFDQVALLDGGLEAWKADGQSLSTLAVDRPATQFTVAARPEFIAERDEVFAATVDSSINIVDALPDAHYRGDFSMYARPGHILGATNMPSSDLLDEAGHYRSFDELDMMHSDDREGRVITYCGGGVAASSAAFTMHRLGFADVAVYMGSLQEWAADPENPMTLNAPPEID